MRIRGFAMAYLRRVIVALSLFQVTVNAQTSSSSSATQLPSQFAGAAQSFVFPPPGVTATATDDNFPDASVVGFPGPTPTGDEAQAIATAPTFARNVDFYPLVKPDSVDSNSTEFDVLHHFGNLSPWQSVSANESFGLPDASPIIPTECELTQVHLIHRHGARYPGSGAAPAAFAASVQNAVKQSTFGASGPLSFLNTWTYKLGAEILTPFGRKQMYDLGVGTRVKYGELLKGATDLPVWRTTSEDRMYESATNFAAGFFGVNQYQSEYHQLVIIENDGQNNTLAPYDTCNNSNNAIGNLGIAAGNTWAQKYLTPAVARLQPHLQGIQLNYTHLIAMQQLCAYESVALGFSQFCGLFTEDEWHGYDYFSSLNFWYSNGPGNPVTAAMGAGWVQELVARLAGEPITVFNTSVNGTLANNITFPLNQTIYVDATHDTILSTILVAMNFTSMTNGGPLPTDHIPDQQFYRSHNVAPFGANLIGQVMSCPASASKTPTHIRWILNDGVVPLNGVNGCGENKDGLCELPTFIAAMKTRVNEEIDFQWACFGNYTIPLPSTIVNGQPPPQPQN